MKIKPAKLIYFIHELLKWLSPALPSFSHCYNSAEPFMQCFMDLQRFLPVMTPHQISHKKSTGLTPQGCLLPLDFQSLQKKLRVLSSLWLAPLGLLQVVLPGLLKLPNKQQAFQRQGYSRVVRRKWVCLWDFTSSICSVIITCHFTLLIMWIRYCLRHSRCQSTRGTAIISFLCQWNSL